MNTAEIHFFSEGIDFILVNDSGVRAWLMEVILSHQADVYEINYIFCSDDYLLALNRSHLKHDYYTDILTFPYAPPPSEKASEAPLLFSDIYISVERVKDNAAELKLPFKQELHRVMAHGILHLLGFDDHSPTDKQKMREAEEQALDLRRF